MELFERRQLTLHMRFTRVRLQPRSSPFDFELQSQTFPALCLQALPPPPSLFSASPFPTATSFPLGPPTVDQRKTVLEALQAQIQQWKFDQLSKSRHLPEDRQNPGPHASSSLLDPAVVEKTAQQHEDTILGHVDLALGHWLSLPAGMRHEMWQLELMRAFSREIEKRKKVESQLARTQQEANQLRTQVERLEQCQWPREFALFPPDLLPLSAEVARELDTKESTVNAPDSARWDYDNVVAKWKRAVMHEKSAGRPRASDNNYNNSNLHAKRQINNSTTGHHRVDSINSARINSSGPGQKNFSPLLTNPVTPESPHLQAGFGKNTQLHDSSRANDAPRQPKRQRTQNSGSRNIEQQDLATTTNRKEQNPSTASTPHSNPSTYPPPPHLPSPLYQPGLTAATTSADVQSPKYGSTLNSLPHLNGDKDSGFSKNNYGSTFPALHSTSQVPAFNTNSTNSGGGDQRNMMSRPDERQGAFGQNRNLDILMRVCSQTQANGS